MDDRDCEGLTALHCAAKYGDLEAAENLINQQQADVNAKADSYYYHPDNNKTPLHLAAENGHDDVVALLLSHSADWHDGRYYLYDIITK